jgi:hypothetical protein
VVERYDEDWSRLGWFMVPELRPRAPPCPGQHLTRYPQLTAMHIESLPVLAVRIDHVASWERLDRD